MLQNKHKPSKNFLKCNDQKNFTMVNIAENQWCWKLMPASIWKVCKGLTSLHKTFIAPLHFLTSVIKILNNRWNRKGFILFPNLNFRQWKKNLYILPLAPLISEIFYLLEYYIYYYI